LKFKKIYNGKTLSVTNKQSFLLLDYLLQPVILEKDGKRIVLSTARQQIEKHSKYWEIK